VGPGRLLRVVVAAQLVALVADEPEPAHLHQRGVRIPVPVAVVRAADRPRAVAGQPDVLAAAALVGRHDDGVVRQLVLDAGGELAVSVGVAGRPRLRERELPDDVRRVAQPVDPDRVALAAGAATVGAAVAAADGPEVDMPIRGS
jgi:hypothetical protein